MSNPNNLNNEKPHIVCILDASGSMLSLSRSVIESFNVFLKDQRLERGEANISLITFESAGNERKPIFNEDCKNISPINSAHYQTGGMTAMYDTIGNTINDIKDKNVFMVIQTDGKENNSTRYNKDQIHKMIADKKREGWGFLFMGTTIDVEEAAKKINLEDSFIEFNKNSKGLEMAFGEMSRGASNYRCSLDKTILRPKSYSRV